MKVLTKLPFAILVAIALLVAGSACFAATVSTPAQWAGVLVSGISVGLSGGYVGTVARRSRRHRKRSNW